MNFTTLQAAANPQANGFVGATPTAFGTAAGQPIQQIIVQAAPAVPGGAPQQFSVPLQQATYVTAAQPQAAPSAATVSVQQQPQQQQQASSIPANNGAPADGNSGSNTPPHPIAEFLYQLTKMLTDNNDEIIEWSHGRIKVHHPERLEGEVLSKYFRHSKFASFQRQLNYFGFRKIAGKGKMSPCSYVNEAATTDIRSLLNIKRKTNGSAARKAALAQQRNMQAATANLLPPGAQVIQINGVPSVVTAPQGTTITADLLQRALGNQQALATMGLGYPQVLFPNQTAIQVAQQQLTGAPAITNQQANANNSAIAALANVQGKKSSGGDLSVLSNGSNPQLDLINQHVLRNSAKNLAALGLGPTSATAALAAASMPSTATIGAATGGSVPASAALTSGAASAAANASQNLFENSNLTALVGKEEKKDEKDDGKAPNTATAQGQLSSSNLLGGRMPSANSIFPDTLSSVSLTGLAMPGVLSSNRLNSIVSLSSLLSRDISTADFGLAGVGAKKPATSAFGAHQLNPLTSLANLSQAVAPAPIKENAPTPGPSAPTPGPAAPTPAPGVPPMTTPAALLAALSGGQVISNPSSQASALLAAMGQGFGQLPITSAPGPAPSAPTPASAPSAGPAPVAPWAQALSASSAPAPIPEHKPPAPTPATLLQPPSAAPAAFNFGPASALLAAANAMAGAAPMNTGPAPAGQAPS